MENEINENKALSQTSVSGSAIEVLKWMADCPINVDEATVPKAGIESNPKQVVVTISVSYVKWKQLQDVVKHYR